LRQNVQKVERDWQEWAGELAKLRTGSWLSC
jgi:hypothetical protein